MSGLSIFDCIPLIRIATIFMFFIADIDKLLNLYVLKTKYSFMTLIFAYSLAVFHWRHKSKKNLKKYRVKYEISLNTFFSYIILGSVAYSEKKKKYVEFNFILSAQICLKCQYAFQLYSE